MDNNFFVNKSVLELVNNFKYQIENNMLDKKWLAALMNHLQNRKISIEEFELIQANMEGVDFVNSLRENVATDVNNTLSKEVKTNSNNVNYVSNNESSSNILGLYLLMLINTAILVFFLMKYLEIQDRMSQVQNNMNNLIP